MAYGQQSVSILEKAYLKNDLSIFDKYLKVQQRETLALAQRTKGSSHFEKDAHEIYQVFFQPKLFGEYPGAERFELTYKDARYAVIPVNMSIKIADTLYSWNDIENYVRVKSLAWNHGDTAKAEKRFKEMDDRWKSEIFDTFVGEKIKMINEFDVGPFTPNVKLKQSWLSLTPVLYREISDFLNPKLTDFEQRIKFLDPLIKTVRAQRLPGQTIETLPRVDKIILNKKATIAKVNFRMPFTQGYALFAKKNGIWKMEKRLMIGYLE